jgi:hypothetical protein
LGSGIYTPYIKVIDAAGNINASNGDAFTVDVDAPQDVTASIAHDMVSDTGSSTTDNLTNNNRPTISGTAEKGASIELVLDGKTYTAISNETTGVWSIDVTSNLASSGTAYIPQITVTDKAGNRSSAIRKHVTNLTVKLVTNTHLEHRKSI